MLEAFKIVLLISLVISLVLLLAGLIRPVYALWFLARFNRLKVIKVYGIASLIFLGIWVLL